MKLKLANLKSEMAPARKHHASQVRRQYNRRPTNNAPTIVPPTSPPQLADLAFNIHGWAMEDGMSMYGGRSTFEVINAYKATMVKGGFGAKIEELQRDEQRNRELRLDAGGDIYRQNLTYTQRELDPNLASTDPAIAQYLVVGYTLQEEDPVFASNKEFLRYSENELVGETVPPADKVINWNSVRTPILVVTPIKENTGTSVRLFGLIMPRSGLCQPVLLTHERIFYRWEFRASAGARATQRNKYWNQIVIDKARELMSPEMIAKMEEEASRTIVKIRETSYSVKPEEREEKLSTIPHALDLDELEVFGMNIDLDQLFASASDDKMLLLPQHGLKFNTDVKLVLTDDTREFIHAIRASKDPSRLYDQLWHFMYRSTVNLSLPPQSNAVFMKFFTLGAPLDMDEAHMLAEEVAHAWPQLQNMVTINALSHIKHVMSITGQTLVSEVCMENFFKFMLSAFQRNPNMGDQEAAHWLTVSIQLSQLLGSDPVVQQALGVGMQPDTVMMVLLLKELFVIHKFQQSASLAMMKMPSLTKVNTTHHIELNFAGQDQRSLFDAAEFLRSGVSFTDMKRSLIQIHGWFATLRDEIRRGG